MRKIHLMNGSFDSKSRWVETTPDFAALKASGYTDVYIIASENCKDNPRMGDTYTAARAAGLGVGFAVSLKDGTSWGMQMKDLQNKVTVGRTFSLPPCVIFGGVSETPNSHNIRGDFSSYFGALVDHFEAQNMQVVLALNTASKAQMLNQGGDTKEMVEDFCRLLKRAKLWLWHFDTTAPTPADCTPWSSVLIWSSSLTNHVIGYETSTPPVVVPARTLVCDISAYQDATSTTVKPDLSKMASQGIKGVVLRCSENQYTDREFAGYQTQCIVHNIPYMVYGFLDYWQPDPAAQARYLLDQLDSPHGRRVWLDFERPGTAFPALPSRVDCLTMIKAWFDVVDVATGRKSGIYLNLATIQYLDPMPEWLTSRPLWLAWPPSVPAGTNPITYTANMVPPSTPFTDLRMWQFSWNGPGYDSGMESRSLDMDWFMGDEAAFKAFCGATAVPPVEELTDHEKLVKLWAAHPELHE